MSCFTNEPILLLFWNAEERKKEDSETILGQQLRAVFTQRQLSLSKQHCRDSQINLKLAGQVREVYIKSHPWQVGTEFYPDYLLRANYSYQTLALPLPLLQWLN